MRIEGVRAAGHPVGEGARFVGEGTREKTGMSIETLKTGPVRPASLWARAESRGLNLVFLAALAASFFVAYLPTYLRLAGSAWRTEQEGHGPLIMLAAARQAQGNAVAPGACRRLDHSHSFPSADGRLPVTRYPNGRGCDPDSGAFGMSIAYRRLAVGAIF